MAQPKGRATVDFTAGEGVRLVVLRPLKAGVLLALKHRPAKEKWGVFIGQSDGLFIRLTVDGKTLRPQLLLPKGMIRAVRLAQEHQVWPASNVRHAVQEQVERYLHSKGYEKPRLVR